MSQEGIIAVKNTAPQFLKGASDQTIRMRIWLRLLQKYGRLKFDGTGHDQSWNVKARQPEIRPNGDAGQQTFAEHDAYEQLTVDVRGYVGTDRLTLKKQLMNQEPLAIVNLYATKMEDLLKSLRDSFGAELYVDGEDSGNENRLMGIETFMSNTGTVTAADRVAPPTSTYAGKSVALGNLGGSWSSNLATPPNADIGNDWPYGQGSSEFDYLAPKLINYTSTGWSSNDPTWRSNCSEVMRRARTWCRSLGGDNMAPMCHMLSATLYDEFEDFQETRFRNIIPHKEADDLGFPDALNFSGAMVKYEYDVPADVGYGLNMNEISLFTIHPNLFYQYGPEWDTQSLSYLFLTGMFGNMRFNPKHFAKYAPYA